MKTFEELNKEITLIRYLGSEFGTMYFQPDLPREKKIIVRHLNNKLTAESLPVYEQLYSAIARWIDSNSKIKNYVFMPNLVEIGKDYIIRPFYVYDIAIRDYYDKEEPVEAPALFEEMISAVSKELNGFSEKDIIPRILRKSLLEPSGKTYYNYRMNKFVIVEPKISLDDLEEWKVKHKF